MSVGQLPVKQIQIARDLDLSPATVSRIVHSLADEGYVLLTSEKYCVCNFRLSRNVPMSAQYLSVLDKVMDDLSHQLQVSVEAVVVAGLDLFWHSCTVFPHAGVAIRARPGFRRTLAELDPLSRLYLSRKPWDQIKVDLLPGGFFRNDIDRGILSADKARRIIESAVDKFVDFDFDGNHLGIRRFATRIDDEEGRFMHLLSIAEPAVPVRDRDAHIQRFTDVLSEARAALNAQIACETADNNAAFGHDMPLFKTG